MAAQRSTGTAPEMALRRSLHRRGLRYRLHRRALPELRRTLDIVFPNERVAVEVRGCFWHACPKHATWPKHNEQWWKTKLEGNRRRDGETEKALRVAGWRLVVVWEHEDAERAASRVERIVRARRA